MRPEPGLSGLSARAGWYVLRVDPRRPSVGDCPVRRVDPAERLALAVPVDGRSAPKLRQPLRAEFVVEQVLQRRGLKAWVPLGSAFNRANRYHRRARALVLQPILTGYVLVELPQPAALWDLVLDCPMVRGVMGFGGVPARVPEAGLERLRAIERTAQARAHHRLMPTGRVFEVGEMVEVLEGPLVGQVARVLAIEGEVARVLCELFGGPLDATIGLDRIGALA